MNNHHIVKRLREIGGNSVGVTLTKEDRNILEDLDIGDLLLIKRYPKSVFIESQEQLTDEVSDFLLNENAKKKQVKLWEDFKNE
jgi:hypothetical protein